MAQISTDRVIFLDDCIDLTQIIVVDWSPILYVIPTHIESTNDIYSLLARCHPNMTVFRKTDIPERLHYQNNIRITPIVGLADLGWSITHREYFNQSREYFNGGNHGYDNKYPEMNALFIAHGPKFNPQQIDLVSSLDIFNLMAHILGVDGVVNNGTTLLVNTLK